MRHNNVSSVMTTEVVRAEYGTPFKEVARPPADHRISGLPVVDEDDYVIGFVVSETDLMVRQAETPDPYQPKRRFRLTDLTRGSKRRAAKARARTSGQLMTEPPVTVHVDDTIVEAARTVARHQVERLPVLDEENRLVGIVTRRDVLHAFLRPDRKIRDVIVREVLERAPWPAPRTVDVSVAEGLITLDGHTERRSEAEIVVSMTHQVDGVVTVVDRLGHRVDDSRLKPREPAMHGIADDWLRKL